ncbi:hypothetical protein BD309DRAFT_954220 [Dichomitus squalens]|uniref:Uncharacterized protein n=2 Tax=Dichomitus squalens TaxID=114155 RepID=A0A4Q9M8X3_9APHY|nr:uncharacterized protein DICSQDRAFT_154649 [Dichomitus squalens LYAD-421 SS1]EJF62250.1 hypothetical protein DICSQDRAFT_154649 [Dichomitus squalens LYAD-421 SS1]TBU22131.1 hypothetical protein BD311DRAFT_770947 [Dichomitus squalens]TBU46414.1 hypothetical protein BD309DRAFT_954220 [Dichomitus squalens]TBU63320.1 hypothetical protein BD310DRAFT_964999 [Dichomitus squalens]
MSLNKAVLSPAHTPIPLQDEMHLREVEGAEFVITLPDASSKELKGKGKVFLTDLRLILVADKDKDGRTDNGFETLAVSHASILAVKSESPRIPVFGNGPRILLEIKPSPGGGLPEGTTRVEIRKGDKDAIASFASAIDKTRERTVNKSRALAEDDQDLPEYGGPGPSSSSTTYVTADVPSDAPPGYEP